MGFTTKFGNSAIVPAQPQYEEIALSTDIELVWPLESMGGVPYVAAQIDVIPSTTGLSIAMPPANQGSTGVAAIVTNVGSDTFTLTDNGGNSITPIATTESWIITLTDNSTVNGTWRAYQLASTASSAVASALAGFGLQAVGAKLQINWPTVAVSINTAIGVSGRSSLFLVSASPVTLTLAASATLGVGFICAVANQSGGNISLATTGGETINGAAGPLIIPDGASGFFICQAGNFTAIGATIVPLPITLGGTGASTANQALINFGGTTIGIDIFTAANAAAVVALLGLTNVPWQEQTISGNTNGASGIFYVCTAALILTLPLTTGLHLYSVIGVNAYGGTVTVTPDVSDTIGGQVAGASTTIGRGAWAFFITDANGKWWPLLGGSGITSPAAAGTINLSVTDQTVLIDTSAAVTTVNLNAAYSGIVTIKDKTGQSATNPITIVPPTSTIDGVANAILQSGYGSISVAGVAGGPYGVI